MWYKKMVNRLSKLAWDGWEACKQGRRMHVHALRPHTRVSCTEVHSPVMSLFTGDIYVFIIVTSLVVCFTPYIYGHEDP